MSNKKWKMWPSQIIGTLFNIYVNKHVPNSQTGHSFFGKTIKHIDPNKTHRQGKKAKKE